jgi:hypothetical protein
VELDCSPKKGASLKLSDGDIKTMYITAIHRNNPKLVDIAI